MPSGIRFHLSSRDCPRGRLKPQPLNQGDLRQKAAPSEPGRDPATSPQGRPVRQSHRHGNGRGKPQVSTKAKNKKKVCAVGEGAKTFITMGGNNSFAPPPRMLTFPVVKRRVVNERHDVSVQRPPSWRAMSAQLVINRGGWQGRGGGAGGRRLAKQVSSG